MAKSRKSQGLDVRMKEVDRLPLDDGGGLAVVVNQVIPHRPLKLDDLVMVRDKMNGYLEYCKGSGVIPSNAGFAVTMGVSKSTFEQGMKEISGEHKELYEIFRSVIEDWVVQRLFEPKMSIAAIFYLKQLGWRDDRGMGDGSDNRSVTQIYINGEGGVSGVNDVGGKKRVNIKRVGGKRGLDGE